MFMEVVSILQQEELLPVKCLGPTVCVAVMGRSHHAKARVFCYRLSIDCLEKEGLAGIGKKGVVVAAKALSDETIPENRAASLDLLEMILRKMNSDMQRLVRICGPSLSEKARQLLQERWSKMEQLEASDHSEIASRIFESPQTPRDQLSPFILREAESSTPDQPKGATGGAAALRARLLRIRENSKAYDTVEEPAIHDGSFEACGSVEPLDEATVFAMGMSCLNRIKSVDSPLTEEDSRLLECIETLKRFHAALSKQQHAAAGLSVMQLIGLRDIIAANLNETIECLIP